jgi:phage-related protein
MDARLFSRRRPRFGPCIPAGLRARYLRLTERMVTFGPHLGMPHTRSLGKGLFELRLKSKEGIARVFFGILSNQRIVLLHAFVKKSQKTPASELTIARKRLKEAIQNENTR